MSSRSQSSARSQSSMRSSPTLSTTFSKNGVYNRKSSTSRLASQAAKALKSRRARTPSRNSCSRSMVSSFSAESREPPPPDDVTTKWKEAYEKKSIKRPRKLKFPAMAEEEEQWTHNDDNVKSPVSLMDRYDSGSLSPLAPSLPGVSEKFCFHENDLDAKYNWKAAKKGASCIGPTSPETNIGPSGDKYADAGVNTQTPFLRLPARPKTPVTDDSTHITVHTLETSIVPIGDKYDLTCNTRGDAKFKKRETSTDKMRSKGAAPKLVHMSSIDERLRRSSDSGRTIKTAHIEASSPVVRFLSQSPTTVTPRQAFPIRIKTIQPNRKLQDLLNVMRERTSCSRRMNACGAIKTLSKIVVNRERLARTDGVITTLAFILNDANANITEKQRTSAALVSLSMMEHNRLIVFHSPGVAKALSESLTSPCPKTRQSLAHCVLLLSKQEGNRWGIAENLALLQALVKIVIGAYARQCQENNNDVATAMSDTTGKEKEEELFTSARVCALSTLLQLARVKDITISLARTPKVMNTLVKMWGVMDADSNAICIAIFAELTRHPKNALQLVYQVNGFVQILVRAASSKDKECRKHACFSVQNLSCDSGCRQELATTPHLLSALSKCAYNKGHEDEQISALNSLRNISEDPSNFIHLTNTGGCIDTLTAMSNLRDDSELQYHACDTLATLAHWVILSAMAGMRSLEDEELQSPNLQVVRFQQWR